MLLIVSYQLVKRVTCLFVYVIKGVKKEKKKKRKKKNVKRLRGRRERSTGRTKKNGCKIIIPLDKCNQ